jgi:hypothetical protein
VNKIYYLELLRASEGTLSLVPVAFVVVSLWVLLFQGGLTSEQAAGRKNNGRILSQHDEKRVVPIPLTGIRVEYLYLYETTDLA